MKHMYVIEQGRRLWGPFVDVNRAVEYGETQFGWGSESTWAVRPLSSGSDAIDWDDEGDDDEAAEPEPDSGGRTSEHVVGRMADRMADAASESNGRQELDNGSHT